MSHTGKFGIFNDEIWLILNKIIKQLTLTLIEWYFIIFKDMICKFNLQFLIFYKKLLKILSFCVVLLAKNKNTR